MALVSGVVSGPDGEPVGEARVYFAGGPAPLPDIAALTGPDGSFTLSVPAPGTYELECSADGYTSSRGSVEADGEEARLDFCLASVD